MPTSATVTGHPDPGAKPSDAGGSRDEYGYFEVEYEDGSATVERLRQSEFGGDDEAGVRLVRQRLAERAAAERRPMRAISAVTPVVYSGISKR